MQFRDNWPDGYRGDHRLAYSAGNFHGQPIALAADFLSIALAEPALAQTANIEGVLQNIVNMLTGNVARLLATLAVIIVGIAWMFGYLDLRKAAYVVLGVAITFGASEVVSTLTGGH